MKEDHAKPIILMLITNYGHGGAQRVFAQLTNILSNDYQIVKVCFDDDESEQYESNGINVSLNVKAGKNFFHKGIQFLKRCWKLSRLKNQYTPVYTISHLEGANFVNILSGNLDKAILCVHGSKTALDSNRKGLVKFIENRLLTPILYNKASKIVTVSNEIAYELFTFFRIKKQKIVTIHNAIDLKYIIEISKGTLTKEEGFVFNNSTLIYVGRLASQKNTLALLKIYNKLENKREINLLIIGDGILREEMIAYCKNNQIPFQIGLTNSISHIGRVIFLGFTNNPFKFLKHSKIFLLPSDFEGFPLALCEAMALSIPVIATDCPTGAREIIAPYSEISGNHAITEPEEEKFGTLMPLINSESSIETWANYISNKLYDTLWIEKMSVLSKKRADQFSLDKYKQDWTNLLK